MSLAKLGWNQVAIKCDIQNCGVKSESGCDFDDINIQALIDDGWDIDCEVGDFCPAHSRKDLEDET